MHVRSSAAWFFAGRCSSWLATDIRRHMWHHTSVDGDALEYTGRAKELFFGALLALGILAPLYLIYFVIAIEAERWKAFASVPFGLFFYLFTQFAIYRARRYRMTRTVWRGVRFWMTGSGWNYAFRSAGWMLLVILTFGLALPWRDAALERFKTRHSHYGNLQGRFEGAGWDFFKRGIWLWLIGVAVISLPFLEVLFTKQAPTSSMFAVILITMIGGPFFYAAFKAVQWRWWMSGIRFGNVRFSSDLIASDLFGLYWKVVGWLVLISVIAGIAITALTLSAALLIGVEGTVQEKIAAGSQHWFVQFFPLISYLITALMLTAVLRIYLIHDLSAEVAASTTVHNIAAAETVAAGNGAASAIGEGLADSLEMFGF